ncbi:endonuclease domain-containing protein [Sinomonas humi]|uniref:endonuclease domain-containing protein n=1 Tax=Sinomonas humi TaxID=1338436 RepID=UPI001E370FF9|nr:endonuclease domain-containing protein [Sinomonas humi]
MPPRFASASFTVADAKAAQLSPSRLRASDLSRPSRGVRVPRGARQSLAQRAAPYLRLSPSAVLSHGTALRLLGLPLPRVIGDDQRLHLATPGGRAQIRRRGVAGHRATLDGGDIQQCEGLAVTSHSRTFLDIAATDGVLPDELVVLGDALVNEHRRYAHAREPKISLEELKAYVEAARGRRGAAKARAALALVRVGADSPMETRLRLAVQRAGLPDPEVDYPVIDELGQPVFVELAFPEYRLAVQYDGGHHLTPEQQRFDALRAQRLAGAGWRQVIITKLDMGRGAEIAVVRIAEALRRLGWEDLR